MTRLLRRLFVAIAGVAAALSAPVAVACGNVTIAEMNWASAEFAAHIDRIILEEGFGCTVALVPGDTVPTLTSMAEKGVPDIAPEAWINSARDLLERAVDEGRLIHAAEILSDGTAEGWWIPQYIKDAHPEIETISDALMRPDLFPHPEYPELGAVFGCPSGWGCQYINENLFRAWQGSEKGFELVDPGSAAGLDGSLASAWERREPWLGYYWAPTALLGKYPMFRLDFGVEHDPGHWHGCTAVPECPDPRPNAWVQAAVHTIVTTDFAAQEPEVLAYLQKRRWPSAVANDVLAWMDENQFMGEDAAWYFLENYPNLWTDWVTEDTVAKINSAL